MDLFSGKNGLFVRVRNESNWKITLTYKKKLDTPNPISNTIYVNNFEDHINQGADTMYFTEGSYLNDTPKNRLNYPL